MIMIMMMMILMMIIIIIIIIIISNNKKGTYLLIDAAISGHRNVIKKEDERILEYKNFIKKFSFCGMRKQN